MREIRKLTDVMLVSLKCEETLHRQLYRVFEYRGAALNLMLPNIWYDKDSDDGWSAMAAVVFMMNRATKHLPRHVSEARESMLDCCLQALASSTMNSKAQPRKSQAGSLSRLATAPSISNGHSW